MDSKAVQRGREGKHPLARRGVDLGPEKADVEGVPRPSSSERGKDRWAAIAASSAGVRRKVATAYPRRASRCAAIRFSRAAGLLDSASKTTLPLAMKVSTPEKPSSSKWPLSVPIVTVWPPTLMARRNAA